MKEVLLFLSMRLKLFSQVSRRLDEIVSYILKTWWRCKVFSIVGFLINLFWNLFCFTIELLFSVIIFLWILFMVVKIKKDIFLIAKDIFIRALFIMNTYQFIA